VTAATRYTMILPHRPYLWISSPDHFVATSGAILPDFSAGAPLSTIASVKTGF